MRFIILLLVAFSSAALSSNSRGNRIRHFSPRFVLDLQGIESRDDLSEKIAPLIQPSQAAGSKFRNRHLQYAAVIVHDDVDSLINPLSSLLPLLSRSFHLYIHLPITSLQNAIDLEAKKKAILEIPCVSHFLNVVGGAVTISAMPVSRMFIDKFESLGNTVPYNLDFWLGIAEQRVLYFQWDVGFCNNSGLNIEYYLDNFDFVGAPWDKPQRISGVDLVYGNGGLTVRSR